MKGWILLTVYRPMVEYPISAINLLPFQGDIRIKHTKDGVQFWGRPSSHGRMTSLGVQISL